nr:MAG TPA: hypothetical protein [Caudoviricetes sp.]
MWVHSFIIWVHLVSSGCGLILQARSRQGGGGRSAISGRRGSSSRKFVSGFFLRLYRSKYQLFNFSARNTRTKPVYLGNDNDT